MRKLKLELNPQVVEMEANRNGHNTSAGQQQSYC
jgi:hypothetical protein